MQKEVKQAPVPLKVPGRLGVKGRTTFWKNHSVRLGVMKKTPAAMKIMPTLTLATQRGTKMMRTTMDLEMISIHHKLTQELLRTKVLTNSIAYASYSFVFLTETFSFSLIVQSKKKVRFEDVDNANKQDDDIEYKSMKGNQGKYVVMICWIKTCILVAKPMEIIFTRWWKGGCRALT